MALADVLRERFRRSIDLFRELVEELPEATLTMTLPGLPSNTIGAQLWCVVGARESYSRATNAGAWSGFACSLSAEATQTKMAVLAALSDSGAALLDILRDLESYDDVRHRFVVDLLEHEAAHQGQLIRYLYGLKLPVPGRWKARYALD